MKLDRFLVRDVSGQPFSAATLRSQPTSAIFRQRGLRCCQGVFSLKVPRLAEESIDEDVIISGRPPGTNAYNRRVTRRRYSLCEAFSFKGLRASTVAPVRME